MPSDPFAAFIPYLYVPDSPEFVDGGAMEGAEIDEGLVGDPDVVEIVGDDGAVDEESKEMN